MLSFNQELFLAINSYAGTSQIYDTFAIFLAKDLQYLFIAIEIWLYFFASLKEEALLAFYTMLLGLAINALIGIIYYHPRPFVDKLGNLLIHHRADSSFPSDHTTFMASIALTLLLLSNTRKLGAFLLVLAIIGGLARVYVGVHYPFDILGSLIVSLISAIIIISIAPIFNSINKFFYKIEDFLFKGKIDV